MNKAISKQKLTFILTGYRGVLRISLFADYEQIFNEGLQPQYNKNMIRFTFSHIQDYNKSVCVTPTRHKQSVVQPKKYSTAATYKR